jgi:hypothetical protein
VNNKGMEKYLTIGEKYEVIEIIRPDALFPIAKVQDVKNNVVCGSDDRFRKVEK